MMPVRRSRLAHKEIARRGQRRLQVESLELRLLLASDVNILVSTEFGLGDNRVIEFDSAGTEIRQYQVPYGTGGTHPPTEYVRDLVVDPNDDIQIYNGTFNPFLSTLDPDTSTYQHHTTAGWSTVNNVSYGGIGVFEQFVFVTDMATAGAAEQGIIRFDSANGYAAQRFATSAQYIDLTIGLDGLLYGLWSNEQTVSVYDPASLTLQRTFRLRVPNRALAVNQAGEIFAASWNGNIYHFNSSGIPLNSVSSGTNNLTDIDVHSNGDLVVGSRFSRVVLTDESLSSPTSFVVDSDPVFVSFAEYVAPGSAADGEIQGNKFEDLNGNGVRDNGEGPLAGVTIYLDQNNNGILDDGETMTQTDEEGRYAFAGLAVGEYVVREIVPSGYQQTSPAYTESFYAYLYVPGSGGLMQPARIDPQTGQVQRLGTPQGNVQQRMHGLVRTNDGEFYGLNGFNPDTFFQIDLFTNQITAVGALGTNAAFGLAYDSATDTIYALARDPADNLLKLSTVDRTNGQLSFIGPGTNQLTATSGLAWDPERDVVVAFDNADDQFWQFDVNGNPTLLWDTSGLDGWGFAYNGDHFSLWARRVGNNDRFWSIDPYAQTAVLGLTASEPVPMESLDYFRVERGHLVYVGEGDVVTGFDFGNWPVNRPPVADADGPYAVPEGGSVILDASGSFDPDAGDVLSYAWDLDGDGVFGEIGAAAMRGDEVGVNPVFIAADLDGPTSAVVDLRVTDSGNLSDEDSATIQVANVAPEINSLMTDATFDDRAQERQTVLLNGEFSDAGTLDTHTATVNWGDGTPTEPATVIQRSGGGSVIASHEFGRGGVFTVTLVVTDDDSGQDTRTTLAVVAGMGVNDGVLHIVGDANDNVVTVNQQSGKEPKVHVDFIHDDKFRTFDPDEFDSIRMWLGAGDDIAIIAGNVEIPALMDGEGGDDHLKAGAGPAVLLGGMGADSLIGGRGRDILIGGLGADRLIGGSDDDILIGGWTDFDSNDLALLSLLDEWNSERDYEARVLNLRAGSGPILGGTGYRLEKGVTVFDDGALDRLTGSSDRDWFFFDPLEDDVTDKKHNEEAN